MRRSERNGIASEHDEFDWDALAQSWNTNVDSKIKEIDVNSASPFVKLVSSTVTLALVLAVGTLYARGAYEVIVSVWNIF